MYLNSYTKSKFKIHIPFHIPNINSKKFWANLLYFYLHGSNIKKLSLFYFLDLIWNCFEFVVFPFHTKLGQYNEILGTQQKTIHSNCLYSLIFQCCCLHFNNNTNILHSYWKLQLTLWILACIVLSRIHGFVNDVYWRNHFRGATIHLIMIYCIEFLIVLFTVFSVTFMYWVHEIYQ